VEHNSECGAKVCIVSVQQGANSTELSLVLHLVENKKVPTFNSQDSRLSDVETPEVIPAPCHSSSPTLTEQYSHSETEQHGGSLQSERPEDTQSSTAPVTRTAFTSFEMRINQLVATSHSDSRLSDLKTLEGIPAQDHSNSPTLTGQHSHPETKQHGGSLQSKRPEDTQSCTTPMTGTAFTSSEVRMNQLVATSHSGNIILQLFEVWNIL
jgi:hypothetical protein